MKYITSELERSKPKNPGFSAIANPSEPPVTSRHFKAIENTSCENASVSIRKGTPPVRTQNQPISPAAAAASAIPAVTPSQASIPNCVPSTATA